MRRRHNSGKRDSARLVKDHPPIPLIERRNWRAVKECQTMKIRERIGDFVVVSVYLAYPIHRPSPQQIYFQERTEDTSFTQHDLGAEPHCSDNPGNDHCNYGLERIALRLLDTSAPAAQVLKISPHFGDGFSHCGDHACGGERTE